MCACTQEFTVAGISHGAAYIAPSRAEERESKKKRYGEAAGVLAACARRFDTQPTGTGAPGAASRKGCEGEGSMYGHSISRPRRGKAHGAAKWETYNESLEQTRGCRVDRVGAWVYRLWP
jgi:hypothetical protein